MPTEADVFLCLVPQSIKLQFYDMMVQYGLRHHAYLDVAKYYHKVWETPSIKEDVSGKGKTVRFVLSFPRALVKFDVFERHSNILSTTLLSPRSTTNSPT